MADLALRFILANRDVGVVIPGMRKPAHVRSNIAASDVTPLPPELLERLLEHRWDRVPTAWSQ
jgi:aryl-alcohol dehydrogenase-like predicted oxidoreductase